MYALALYRILPSMNRLLSNINHIAFAQHSLDLVDEALHLPIEEEGNEPVTFGDTVSIDNVSFKYATGGEVINNISLTIRKGEKIAVTGESGSGKSTLIDLIIGIHKPSSGEISVDGKPLSPENIKSWRRKIGYIPQSIYLFDGTVGENVAYGAEVIEEKIIASLKKANIWDFLSTKDGLNTKVGQGGVQLSGGQQQRIGIARALYDNPEILVLDEATSALDNETEEKIMDEIYSASENKTLIVIAHRLSTVERCQRKIRLDGGKIV
jgi:ATP-binding cassette subfamily B protein/ATP-binding cassette subfamily C protein